MNNDITIRTLINTEILKPCPFCGKNVGLISDSEIRKFVFTHASISDCPFYKIEVSWNWAISLTKAKELWNRRCTNG